MNRILFTLLLAVFTIAATAQYKYEPLPLGKGQWRYRTISTYLKNVVVLDYLMIGSNADTIINGKTYKRILQREHSATGFTPFGVAIQSFVADAPDRTAAFIREDNKKVYWFYFSPSAPPKDTLIYDFNRIVNDTLPTVFNYSIASGNSTYIIRHIDSVETHATLRKRFIATSAYNPADTIEVVEGIGSDRGLLMNNYSGNYGQYNLSLEFHCYTEPTLSYNPHNIPCTYIWNSTTPVSVKTTGNLAFRLYPNPFTETLSVETPRNAVVTMYNAVGHPVMHKQIPGGNSELQVSGYPAGIYFINLQDEDGQALYRTRVLKQ
ncbi:MAG: Secretion system C-terminal sorting domain [Flavipsychrobacter sp.]|jgi:hypothetical protein|nr:Secretion system C-terminal sorting domain [Flavipsychrobacter sp.]